MASARPVVFDTTIYIEAIRGGAECGPARLLRSRLPQTYLASVVAAELRAGAVTAAARRSVTSLVAASQRVGRLVTPTFVSWSRAGEVLAAIRNREPEHASKLPRLWPDLLIAVSARQIGAVAVTENREDFALLRRHLVFSLEIVAGS
jgi:predicted nucleic acid-binding protein